MNPLIALLSLLPAGTSFVLGTIFLFLGEARPVVKGGVAVVFAIALYLQFVSAYSLTGLLIQTALALCLAIWKRWAA